MGRDFGTALGFVCLMLMAPLSGCFGEGEIETLSSESLDVAPTVWTGGLFQTVSFEANGDIAVFIPYLIKDLATGFVSNSTVLNIEDGDVVELSSSAATNQSRCVVNCRLWNDSLASTRNK